MPNAAQAEACEPCCSYRGGWVAQTASSHARSERRERQAHPFPLAPRLRLCFSHRVARSRMDGTSPSSPLRFSLVIPIYNEEDNVDALVDELKETLPALGAHEIVAVDDGSTDRTPDKLRQRMRDCPSLRVLRLAQNRGQSAALAAGFDH